MNAMNRQVHTNKCPLDIAMLRIAGSVNASPLHTIQEVFSPCALY